MNYELSEKILNEVKKANKILVSCHRSPDPDGIGSALAIYETLLKMDKEVIIVCPSEIPSEYKFLPGSQVIKRIDFSSFDFSGFDLMIAVDSSNWGMISGKKDFVNKDVNLIVIDHHITNEGFGNINLVDVKKSSAAEVTYLVLKDWGMDISKDIAQNLLAGIICDTGVFQYPNVTYETLEIAKDLMLLGADKNEIILKVYRSVSFAQLKFWGEIIARMKKEEPYGFIWSAIPYEDFVSFGKPLSAKETAASTFAPIVEETDFGMIMIEQEKGALSISFRSRENFDVSKIATDLGGGGHKVAAGAKIYGLDFNQAVEKALDVAKKYAKES